MSDGKKHAPRTEAHGDSEAVPTVSASGLPRIIPRHKDKRTDAEQDDIDEKEGDAPSELQRHESDDDDELDADEEHKPNYPPTGSLTLAAFDPYSAIPWSRRMALITGSIFINLGLPFLNGIMLGFGEIFARVVVAPALGITGVGWAGDTARAVVNWSMGRRAAAQMAGEKRQAADVDDWSSTDAQTSTDAHLEL